MTDEQQRIAPNDASIIANACGRPELEAMLLDERLAYFAMHEAERTLSEEFDNYLMELEEVTKDPNIWKHNRQYICATAAKRAEAFLRMKGLWKE